MPDREPRWKSKSDAMCFAVFLGPWVWVYTLHRNDWKASLGLALNGTLFTIAAGIVVSGLTAKVPSAVNPADAFGYSLLLSIIPLVMMVPVWLWARSLQRGRLV